MSGRDYLLALWLIGSVVAFMAPIAVAGFRGQGLFTASAVDGEGDDSPFAIGAGLAILWPIVVAGGALLAVPLSVHWLAGRAGRRWNAGLKARLAKEQEERLEEELAEARQLVDGEASR